MAEKSLWDEITALKKLPKSADIKAQIVAKKRQLNSLPMLRGSGTIDDDGDTYTYESFEGKFNDGTKAVLVVRKYNDRIYWSSVAIFTWMTEAEAEVFFGNYNNAQEAYGNGLEYSEWYSDDTGNDWNFLNSIKADLGIVGAKGYFDGYGESYATEAISIIHGQKFYIVVDVVDEPEVVINNVTFPESSLGFGGASSSSSAWLYVVIAILIVYILQLTRK